MITGIINPLWLWVLALKDLQNSIMFIPYCPKAGPTGGAGVALPAGGFTGMVTGVIPPMCNYQLYAATSGYLGVSSWLELDN